jgi:16S rRNA (cytosine1402-N4)-methyltransferase
MVKEVIEVLNIKRSGIYVDLTLGGAGHFKKILEKLETGTLIGIDKDEKAIANALEEFGPFKKEGDHYVREKGSLKIIIYQGNYSNLGQLLNDLKIANVNGILADLGLATDQYRSGLGLSYLEDSPLDMRMEPGLMVTAADLLNGLYFKELILLFKELGDISFAKRLAKEVVEQRSVQPFKDTKQLVAIVQKIVPFRSRTGTNKHPEAKVFQALRIAVNREQFHIQQLLPQAYEALAPGGVFVVISFHSGEDRFVKQFFIALAQQKKCELLIKLAKPSEVELEKNLRSHSAKLRAIRKI